jgi:predicted DNA-binding protein (MmcQ/YjbR family)
MELESIRRYCLTLPHTTEDVQWECLLFRIARKIYLLVNLETGGKARLSFKCTPADYAELIECEGIIPAPYMARNHWVALATMDALPAAEIRRRIKESYELVKAGLPKKTLRELSGS